MFKPLTYLLLGAMYCGLQACSPDTSGYKCINGNCVPISDDADYSNLSDCLSGCDTIGYNCVNGICVEVTKDSATYTRKIDCQTYCH